MIKMFNPISSSTHSPTDCYNVDVNQQKSEECINIWTLLLAEQEGVFCVTQYGSKVLVSLAEAHWKTDIRRRRIPSRVYVHLYFNLIFMN